MVRPSTLSVLSRPPASTPAALSASSAPASAPTPTPTAVTAASTASTPAVPLSASAPPAAAPPPLLTPSSVSSASGLSHNPHASTILDPLNGGMAVEALDESTARVIATVLAQSVALEHYARLVDRFLNEFSEINAYMVRLGRLPVSFRTNPLRTREEDSSALVALVSGRLAGRGRMTKRELLRKIAQTNLLLTDVLLKIKVLDRMPDLACTCLAIYDCYALIGAFVCYRCV